MGVGLRVKKFAFIPVRVYAIGLYVSDSALAGPLKGKATGPEFYRELVSGDFAKEVHLRFVRDLGEGRIRGAMREALAGADTARTEAFVSYFPEVKSGQTCVLRVGPGRRPRDHHGRPAPPPIADKTFASAVFGIWLGEKPIQEDITRALVSRAAELLK